MQRPSGMPGAVSEIRGVDAAGGKSRLKVIKGAAKSNKRMGGSISRRIAEARRTRSGASQKPCLLKLCDLCVDLLDCEIERAPSLESMALFSIFFPDDQSRCRHIEKERKDPCLPEETGEPVRIEVGIPRRESGARRNIHPVSRTGVV